ncbi:ferric reductase-like transmembrane domain-containing protein [Promicromonospora sp. NPDC059942]|uniref:ferredoxin reductase family protein n=1 Tax=Promicromonospora sp. NPDC059942 TaxID=3347009 RepID=UPI003665C84B
MGTLLRGTSTPAPAVAPRPPAGRDGLRRLQAWRAAGIAALWLTSLFVVALWVSGGGVQAAGQGGGPLVTTLGRLTGLVSANLLLYQVLLMARVPLFERAFGRDALTQAHRRTGFWSFWLFLAHIVLITLGYAAVAGSGVLAQLWLLVRDYPGMLLAAAGTALLVGVVGLSIRRARRRMRYESWHLLHLYAYLGVGLALPHQLWTGADFLASPAATWYWWTLWAVAAGCALVYRVAVPLLRSARHDLRVAEVVPDGRDGVTVRMTGRGLDRLGVRAGQFLVWRFLDGPGWTRGHPFSVSARPAPDGLSITARVVGDGTARLTRLRPGTRVLVEGPYGHLVGAHREGTKLLMLGAGAGVAPLVALLQAEQYAPGDATLVTRDSTPEAALLSGDVAALVRERGVRHQPLDGPRTHVSSPWLPGAYEAWQGPQLIAHLAPDLAEHDVYLCGPVPWMDAVHADLDRLGVPRSRVHSEAFAV